MNLNRIHLAEVKYIIVALLSVGDSGMAFMAVQNKR